MNEHLIALVNDLDVRAMPEVLDEDAVFTFARAFGTLSKRRGLARCAFVVGFDDVPSSLKVRSSLISGLVMAGHDVNDIGVTTAREYESMQNILNATAGIRVAHHVPQDDNPHTITDDEATLKNANSQPQRMLEVYMHGGPLVGQALKQVCEVLEEGAFSSGTGSLKIVDAQEHLASQSERPKGDTLVVGVPHA